MKIVHYTTSLSRSGGGVFSAVSGLARTQAALGADVTVIGGADLHFPEDRHGWGAASLRPHPFRFGRYGLDPAVFRALLGEKADILHIHGLWSAASIYGALLPATVVSLHGMLDPWILRRRPRLKSIHAALWERPMLRRAHIHALTEREHAEAAAFLPVAASRCFVLPNGIDLPQPPPDTPRHGALYLGRLHEKKQVLPLIAAWSKIENAPPLTIAGWGDPAYRHAVAAAARASRNVTFVGPLHGPDKTAALHTARLFVLPSLGEGLPMAALEALAHGCLPLLTDGCNLPHLFAGGLALRIDADFHDLADRLSQLAALDATAWQDRTTAARAHAETYHWNGIARTMLDHYSRILGQRPAFE